MARTKKVTSDSLYNEVVAKADKFVAQKGQDVTVEEFVKGVALTKGDNVIMINSPIDANLVIVALQQYMKRNYPNIKR